MNKFLQTIAEEKNGFSFGKSWRYSEDSLVALLPILRKSRERRKYMLLREAEKIEVFDTGNINKIRILNNEKKPIFVRMGEIFVGKTQGRTTVRSYVIMPGEKTEIEVRCIHASKSINTGSSMVQSGLMTSNFDSLFSWHSFRDRSVSQRTVWNTISETSNSFCNTLFELASNGTIDSTIGSSDVWATEEFLAAGGESSNYNWPFRDIFNDDFKNNLDQFSKQIEKILSEVPILKNQVGLVTLDLKGVSGLEVFDLKDSWKALREDIIKREGEKLSKIQKDSPFEYKKGKAVKIVKNLLKTDFEEKVIFKNKDYRIIGLNSEKFTGEITELHGRVIHCTLVRKKGK